MNPNEWSFARDNHMSVMASGITSNFALVALCEGKPQVTRKCFLSRRYHAKLETGTIYKQKSSEQWSDHMQTLRGTQFLASKKWTYLDHKKVCLLLRVTSNLEGMLNDFRKKCDTMVLYIFLVYVMVISLLYTNDGISWNPQECIQLDVGNGLHICWKNSTILYLIDIFLYS